MSKLTPWLVASLLLGLNACGGGSSGGGSPDSGDQTPDTSEPVGVTYAVGEFVVRQLVDRIRIEHSGREIWASVPGESWVSVGVHELEAEEIRGSFEVDEHIRAVCDQLVSLDISEQDSAVVMVGRLTGVTACETDFTFTLQQPLPGHLQFHLQADNPAVNLTRLHYASTADERFHGFGEQYTHLNLKGHEVPVLSEEGGVGRGRDVIAAAVNLVSPGSSGTEYTTYYAVPQYITSRLQSLFLENTEYAVFDLTQDERVDVRLFSAEMTGRVLAGDSMLALVERFTEFTGRMRPLPDWFNQGAILGLQGGTDKVNGVLDRLAELGTPVAGVWLQDWVGKRQTAAGSQLWWNWELDKDWYPGWDSLVDRIEQDFGGHMLCYINAFLVDASDKGSVRRNLYQEAIDNGYLVMKTPNDVYEVTNTDFDAGMIDFTNPAAVQWLKSVIKDNLIDEGRCRGWMHDFAEALPFDAILHSGEDAAVYHNQYTVDWAKLGREAIEEAGLGDEIVFFNRAGYTHTPTYSTLIWQGDQMTTWDEHDGFKSAVIATLSSGFSGISLTHSDIGGYANMSVALADNDSCDQILATLGIDLCDPGFNRQEDLLLRWMEFSAFTTAYRTHEGLRPETNAQFYSNDTTYAHFDKFAKVYKALAFYREQLFDEAATKGWPVVRHPMMYYPDDADLAEFDDHFFLGEEFLVAPVVDKFVPGFEQSGDDQWKKVYFPDADNQVWVHLFTGEKFGKDQPYTAPPFNIVNPARGHERWVRAPFGSPPVFYREGSSVAAQVEANLQALGVK